jgi:hypothetical protein
MEKSNTHYFYDKMGEPSLSFKLEVDSENNLVSLEYAGEKIYPPSTGPLQEVLDKVIALYPALTGLKYCLQEQTFECDKSSERNADGVHKIPDKQEEEDRYNILRWQSRLEELKRQKELP